MQSSCNLAIELLHLFSSAAVAATSAQEAEQLPFDVLLAAAAAKGTSLPVAEVRAAAVRQLSPELYDSLPATLATQSLKVRSLCILFMSAT